MSRSTSLVLQFSFRASDRPEAESIKVLLEAAT